jgi:O-antigen/teichoic acid export membrane protein
MSQLTTIDNSPRRGGSTVVDGVRHLGARLRPRLHYGLGEASNALNLLLVAVVARVLGVEPYGDFMAMLAGAGILGQIAEFGFPLLVARSVARRPKRAWAEIRFAVARQAALMVPVLGLMYAYLTATGIAPHLHVAGLLIAASVCFQAMKGTLRGACRGLHHFGTEALFLWSERAGLLVFGVAAVALGGGLPSLAGAFFAVRGVDLALFTVVMYRRVGGGNGVHASDLSLAAAAPFAVGAFLWLAYYQIDTAMIALLSTAHDTGIFGAVYRFVDVLHVLPRLIVTVTFPTMVVAWANDPQRLSALVAALQRRLAYVAVPAVLIIIVWGDALLRLGFGDDFAEGAPALRMLAVGTFFAFYSVLFSQTVVAAGRERHLARVLFGAVTVNVLLNMLLIPRYGFMGAATATLVTELVYVGLLAGIVYTLRRPVEARR